MMGLRILIAGGGTGGHLFPGIAIAQAFTARGKDTIVRFVGTDRPFEKRVLKQAGFQHTALKIEGVKGRGLANQVKALARLPVGFMDAFKLIFRFRPQLVVGVGGYAAFPVVLMAWLLGIKRVLHEQNISAGLTNRFLALFVNRIYLSFENTRRLPGRRRQMVSGNPLREEIVKLGEQTGNQKRGPAPLRVLVLGGSQGAHRINTAMIAAAKLLKATERIRLVHQTGQTDYELVKNTYAKDKIEAAVAPFFTDMADKYQNADLIVCRAGATTVAEISVIGKAAIFIPFPHATDDHQTGNARALVKAKAALMMAEKDLDGMRLAAKINYLAKNRAELDRIAVAARSFGRPQAAETIVEDSLSLLKIPSGQGAQAPSGGSL